MLRVSLARGEEVLAFGSPEDYGDATGSGPFPGGDHTTVESRRAGKKPVTIENFLQAGCAIFNVGMGGIGVPASVGAALCLPATMHARGGHA